MCDRLGLCGASTGGLIFKHFNVVGFDVNKQRIVELKSGFDRTNEVESFSDPSTLVFTHDKRYFHEIDVFM